ncbi:hypothetical protein [Modestobacter italicus]|uniref:hypothetical protein n=1 Tax=Modestobacter italicus (strain DSM 44449 / CECT 9708 / BC 501) TaxID=2732864 RepID=UPI001C93FB2D|nr:hypothetical protein [Modestobacter italicus]
MRSRSTERSVAKAIAASSSWSTAGGSGRAGTLGTRGAAVAVGCGEAGRGRAGPSVSRWIRSGVDRQARCAPSGPAPQVRAHRPNSRRRELRGGCGVPGAGSGRGVMPSTPTASPTASPAARSPVPEPVRCAAGGSAGP